MTNNHGQIAIAIIYAMNAKCQSPYITAEFATAEKIVTGTSKGKPYDLAHLAKEGKIHFNLHPEATDANGVQFSEEENAIFFGARFNGEHVIVTVPMENVTHVWDNNTGQIKVAFNEIGEFFVHPEFHNYSPELTELINTRSLPSISPALIRILANYMRHYHNSPVFLRFTDNDGKTDVWGVVHANDFSMTSKEVGEHAEHEVTLKSLQSMYFKYTLSELTGQVSPMTEVNGGEVYKITAVNCPTLRSSPVPFEFTEDKGFVIHDPRLAVHLGVTASGDEPKLQTPAAEIADMTEVEKIAEESGGKVVMAKFGRK